MSKETPYILVTGATGFIGAHVVDNLLSRGYKVRGATRSLKKGESMRQSRPQYSSHLDFVQVGDFTDGDAASFVDAVQDITGIIHVASPLSYDITDAEKELIQPAINGVKAILTAASNNPKIKRVVITSSFASVMDANRKAPPRFTYTADDWNPLTYAESIDKNTSAVIAYRGSKKFAELEAWDFVKSQSPSFDIATLCPPMTFGPIAHPVEHVSGLNESNAMLWKVAKGEPLAVARVPFWIDVRDLAQAHVEALVRPEAGNKRFTLCAEERFNYGLVAEIVREEFEWARDKVRMGKQNMDESYDLDFETAKMKLGLKYRSFRESVVDFITQARDLPGAT